VCGCRDAAFAAGRQSVANLEKGGVQGLVLET
jgi:hypothetical protein